MIIYLFNYILLIAGGSAILLNGNVKNRKLCFCMFAALQWIALSGLRHVSVGADTIIYRDWHFLFDLKVSWSQCWAMAKRWVAGADVEQPAFMLLQKIFHIFSHDFQLWLIFVAILFTVPMTVWIYKYSTRPLLSFVIYFCLFSSFFSITGISQTLATAISVFGGYKYIKNRKIVPYILLMGLAIFFHKSAFCTILLFWAAAIRLSSIGIFLMVFCFFCEMIFYQHVMEVISKLSGYEMYMHQTAGRPYTFALLYCLVIMVVIWRRKQIRKLDSQVYIWENAVYIGFLLMPLIFVNATAMRAVQYFSVYLMLLIPAVLDTLEKRDSIFVEVIMMLVLGIMFFLNNPQYKFFWQ